jgi:hypothetical protein
MSSRSEILILVEDNRQKLFIRRFLLRVGIDKRQMIFAAVSGGHGSGKQWVRNQFADQVRKCRQRNKRASTSMFAVMDADEQTVARCLSDLDDELIKTSQARVDKNHDRVARLIPKRNIETWILCLTSHKDVQPQWSEEQSYKDSKRAEEWDQLTPQASEALYAWTRPAAVLPENLISSLRLGIQEIPRALPVGR